MRETLQEKFKAQDLDQALKFADIAKQLHPQFDGIDQLLAAYNVHIAASRKRFSGETDWYAVLGVVDASADNETIKKLYKKMAIMNHPDKNSSVAAESAFKLISEAWNLLSDPTMRKDYDLRSGPRLYSNPSAPTSSNPFSQAPAASSSSGTFGSRACPRCSRPCDYEDKKRSCISCPVCVRRFIFRTSSSAKQVPSSSAEATSSSGAWASTDQTDPGFWTTKQCPCCSTQCNHDNAEGLSITCPNCEFRFFVQSKNAWGISFGKRVCREKVSFCNQGWTFSCGFSK